MKPGDAGMSSLRPYLVRALHAWIVDNNCTPYLLVDAGVPGVEVPPEAVEDGRVVLNLAPQAVASLELGDEHIAFLTRFSGVSRRVSVPLAAARALYAQENGQGMAFAEEGPAAQPPAPASATPAGDDDGPPDNGPDRPAGPPRLRVVK